MFAIQSLWRRLLLQIMNIHLNETLLQFQAFKKRHLSLLKYIDIFPNLFKTSYLMETEEMYQTWTVIRVVWTNFMLRSLNPKCSSVCCTMYTVTEKRQVSNHFYDIPPFTKWSVRYNCLYIVGLCNDKCVNALHTCLALDSFCVNLWEPKCHQSSKACVFTLPDSLSTCDQLSIAF